MNTCGTCKNFGELIDDGHWDDEANAFIKNSIYHKCSLLQHLNGYSGDRWPIAPAGVIDGSGYMATMCVTDEFGCNQWRERGDV